MFDAKKLIMGILIAALIATLVVVLVMSVILYRCFDDNRSLQAKIDLLSEEMNDLLLQAKTDVPSGEDDSSVAQPSDTAKTENSYSEIKGTYECELPNPEGEYPFHYYLQLKENGSYSYTRGSGGHDGIIGYYIIRDNTVVLHPMFSTGMDVSLGALKESESALAINPDGSLSDNSKFVSDFSDANSITLKKTSDKNPDINNNETIRITAEANAIYAR